MSCGWPFHSDPKCEECKQWNEKNGQAIEDYLTNLEIRQAARRAERAAARKTTTRGVSASGQPG